MPSPTLRPRRWTTRGRRWSPASKRPATPASLQTATESPRRSAAAKEQFKLLLAAESQCADEAGFYSGPIPDAELPRLYALELEEIECLQGLGYETPEPPSLQTYIDNYSSGTPWEAAFELYFSLPSTEQTEDALNRINTECPPPASRFTRE